MGVFSGHVVLFSETAFTSKKKNIYEYFNLFGLQGGKACVRCKPECATCDENGECADVAAHQCRYYVQDSKCLARDACPLGTNFVRTSSDASAHLLRNETLSLSPSLECPLPSSPFAASALPASATSTAAAAATAMSREQMLQQMDRENFELLECAESMRQKHVERVCVHCDAQCHPNFGCIGAGNESCHRCAHKTLFLDEAESQVRVHRFPSRFTSYHYQSLWPGFNARILIEKFSIKICTCMNCSVRVRRHVSCGVACGRGYFEGGPDDLQRRLHQVRTVTY